MKKISKIPVFGDISEDVKTIQIQLSDLGFKPIKVDGEFGEQTKNRISEFQNSKDLPGSGIIGPKTINFLDVEIDSRFSIDAILQVSNSEWESWGKQEITGSEKNPDGSYKLDAEGNTISIFKKKGNTETENNFYQKVGRYWKEGAGMSGIDGRNTDAYWSAAFISFVIKNAGAGDKFLYSNQHSKYIRKAILARKNGDTNYGFWGYKLNEHAPKVGDLVCYVRGGSKAVNFDTNSDDYESHVDIVVAKENGVLKVIGGNVINSVSLKHISIDGNGFVNDTQKKWFAVLENRLAKP